MNTQLDLFDLMYDDFKFKKQPVRLVEMFSGIGTQRMGFEKAGIDVDVVAIVEVDKFALLSYAAIHTDYLEIREGYYKDKDLSTEYMVKVLQDKNVGLNFASGNHTIKDNTNIETIRDYYLADLLSKNLGDISKVKGGDLPKGIDMLTYSFPCTDLSKAGQQKGLSDTRSGLVYQVFRIVEELKELDNKPKTLLMENVIDLIQKKFVNEFHEMQVEVENFGYMNYTFTMNAKDYGVAQNRDRVFMLSLPENSNYNEPKSFTLENRLKDYLEMDVNESYYLSDKQVEQINGWNSQQNPIENSKSIDDEYMQTLTAKGNTSMNASMLLIKEATICAQRGRYTENGIDQQFEVGSSDTSNALTTVQKDNYLLIPEATKQGYAEAYDGDGIYLNRPHQKRGVVQKGMIQTLKTSGSDVGVVVAGEMRTDEGIRTFSDNIMGTLRTTNSGGDKIVIENNRLRIRKLTPLECFRLMGIDDKYFYKAQQVTSNSQLYKQAGNAIVVDVFANIVKSLI